MTLDLIWNWFTKFFPCIELLLFYATPLYSEAIALISHANLFLPHLRLVIRSYIRFLWLFFHITPQQQQTSDMFSSQDHYVSLSSSHLNSSLAQSLAVSFANFYDFWSLSLFPCVYTLHVYRYTSTNRTHLIVTNFKQKRSHWTIRSLKFDFLFSLSSHAPHRSNKQSKQSIIGNRSNENMPIFHLFFLRRRCCPYFLCDFSYCRS